MKLMKHMLDPFLLLTEYFPVLILATLSKAIIWTESVIFPEVQTLHCCLKEVMYIMAVTFDQISCF